MSKIFELIKNLADRYGIKPMIATVLSVGMLYMVYDAKIDQYLGVCGAVVIFLILSIFRHLEKGKCNGSGCEQTRSKT